MKEKMWGIVFFCLFLTVNGIANAGGGYLELGNFAKTSNVITVGQVGTEVENGDALKEALESIVDSGETNPYLVKIEPGIYDLGISAILMKSYVRIEGSGKDLTTIQGNTRTNIYAYGLIHGATFSELRSVTLINDFDFDTTTSNIAIYNDTSSFSVRDAKIIVRYGDDNYGVFNDGWSAPKLTDVEIVATGANNWSYGVYNQSWVFPTLKNVEIISTGGTKSFGIFSDDNCGVTAIHVEINSNSNSWGIYNQGASTLTLRDSDVEAENWGIVNQQDNSGSGGGGPGGEITIERSTVKGSAQSIRMESGSGDVYVGYSQIVGPIVGTPTCLGAYDDSFNALNANCE